MWTGKIHLYECLAKMIFDDLHARGCHERMCSGVIHRQEGILLTLICFQVAYHKALRSELAPGDVNRAKALTRCGMGRCQGRYCGLALAELMAAETGAPLARMGWLRAQAPVKPLPLAASEAA